jgi:hypothetical protein
MCAAAQQFLAAHHRLSRCTVSALREIWEWAIDQGEREGSKGRHGMTLKNLAIKHLSLDPEVSDLVITAFDKSWQFVRTDPELAHNDMDEMRTRLSRHITLLAHGGERDLWRLANSAIGQLRRERSAA